MQDLRPGVIDALGTLKSAWHGLAQVLLPTAALITDEGLDGLDVRLIHETAAPIDVTVITLRDKVSGDVWSEAFHFPERAFTQRHELGLEVRVEQTGSENWALVVSAKRLARWVHIVDPHYRATLDWFHLSRGRERRIPLVGRQRNTSHPPEGEVRALNATFSIHCQRD